MPLPTVYLIVGMIVRRPCIVGCNMHSVHRCVIQWSRKLLALEFSSFTLLYLVLNLAVTYTKIFMGMLQRTYVYRYFG